MSQEVRQADLREKSQRLFDGPLKHIRGAALAAALLPLASVVVAPASAQNSGCPSGGICGTVFNDADHDGIQGATETGIQATLTVTDITTGVTFNVLTDDNGNFQSPDVQGGDVVTITVPPPAGFQVSPINSSCVTVCNGGQLSNGVSTTTVTVSGTGTSTSFGFFQNGAANPGTATIGYWKNHASDWPVSSIVVGGKSYTVTEAISWFNKVGKDKSTMMFAQLVAAELSVKIGNDSSCIAPTIAAADAWLTTHPVGSNVAGGSAAWAQGAPIESTLDAYNNGQLCAPHRQ